MHTNRVPSWNRLLPLGAMLLAAFPILAGTTTYTYDTLNRLTGTVAGDGTVIDYSYDAAGNRTNYVVQAATFALTLATAGTGTGTVSGGGNYAAGATVVLTANATGGSTFAGWSPSPCAASFTMPANALTCTATFTAAPTTYPLTLAKDGTGSGTVSGGGNYAAGASVALSATADTGSTFAGWSPSPCAASFTMPANVLTCTATFTVAPTTYPLTLAQAGTGSGTVSGGGNYAAGASVTLTATPATGSTFAGWSPSPCAASFTMPATALTCTAAFNLTGTGTTLSIADVSKAEGNAGTTAANFVVTLSPASAGTVTVKYATANTGSAAAGSDYTAAKGTLTFAPGQTSKSVAVNVIGDKVKEANETFVVNLSAPTGATLADGQGLGTLLNDDGPVLRMVDLSKAEGNSGTSNATLKATLKPASTGTVTVTYATADGTAMAGRDYTAASGTLSFAPGQTSRTFAVRVTGDTLIEPNEILLVNLSAASGATIFDSQGQVTLLNDDGPVLRIADVSKTEGNTGTSPANFAVTLSPASTDTVTVKYATANGTALAGSDYSATSGTLTFAPGQTGKTVAVNVTGDRVKEAKETFVVNLSAPTGATLFDSQGQGTILNED